MKDPDQIHRRYRELQAYVDWTGEDAARVLRLAPMMAWWRRYVRSTSSSAVDFRSDLPQALADCGQIRIVLGNLIRNAVDAMPSGGRLALTGGLRAGRLEIAVSDSGVGIAPADLGRVTGAAVIRLAEMSRDW